MELEFWGKILGIRVWGTNYLEIELIHKLPGIRECASKRVEPTVTVTITLTVTNTVTVTVTVTVTAVTVTIAVTVKVTANAAVTVAVTFAVTAAITLGSLRFTNTLDWETSEYYQETDELHNPRKSRFKVAHFFPQQMNFRRLGLILYRKQTTSEILRKHPIYSCRYSSHRCRCSTVFAMCQSLLGWKTCKCY